VGPGPRRTAAPPHAPGPINAQPAGGPAAQTGQNAGASQPAGEQPAAGTGDPRHPGPDFEPAPWTRIETAPQAYAPIPAVASTGMKPWKIALLFASVLAVVLVAGGIYLAMRKGAEPTPPIVSPQPTQPQFTPTPQPSVTPQPTQPTENPSPPQSSQPTQSPQSPQPTQSQQPTQTPQANEAHLVYTAPGGSWMPPTTPLLPSTSAGPITQYAGHFQYTEPFYSGNSSWVAMMDSLIPRPEWGVEKNQKTGLATMSSWYQASSFSGAALTSKTIVNKKVTVDGKSGWMLQQHYTYSIPGLKSKGETGTFISVQTGKNTDAVFLASIPDTNKDLQADVDAAIKTLKIRQ